jgi:hypothetical protein
MAEHNLEYSDLKEEKPEVNLKKTFTSPFLLERKQIVFVIFVK